MRKLIGRWIVGVTSSVMLIVPAVAAHADDTQQMHNDAHNAGQQMKSAGQNAGNAAESSGQAAGNAAQGAWNSTKSAAQSAGNKAEEAGNKAEEAGNRAQEAGNKAAGAVNTNGKTPPVSDDWITSQVKQKLGGAEPAVTDVDVSTKNDVVTLTGTVSSEAARKQAVDLARHTDGVKQVKDHIKVNPGG